MDKFRSFSIKFLITVICTTFVPIYEKLKNDKKPEPKLAGALVFALIVDPIILFYFYYKKLEYKKRFLRKVYDPGHKVLALFTAWEVVALIPFYYILGKHWMVVFVVNAVPLVIFSILLLFGSSGRRTIQLERNEEFFKIGFLKMEHVENGEICLNKGEVVQILDHSGGNVVVRKSSGRVFEINESCIDDGIDIVL